jgi:DNA sulfur modification protein DndD
MRLEQLVVENFRQFKGRQEIIFADQRSRNVTIVHAENGFGKTTLLKALMWALYGQSGLNGADGKGDDFEKPGEIIHEGTVHRGGDPGRVAATVKLTFKHDEARYVLTRRLTLAQQRHNPNDTELTLEAMRDGQTFAQDRPQQRIHAIVPPGIAPLLFFNGERINYLAMERNSEQVTAAIQQMLGLKLLQTTIDDLKHQNVRGKLRNEQRDSASKEKQDLLLEQSAKESELIDLNSARKQCRDNGIAVVAELAAVDSKLAANRTSFELQAKRARLTAERDGFIIKRDDIVRRLSKLIAEDGYTLFANDLVTRGRDVVARLRSEGKIPAKVLNSFLKELLDSGNCICRRCLDVGTPERAAVEALLTVAGDQEFNNAVGDLDHAMGLIEGVARQTEDQLKQLNIERLELAREIRNRSEEVEDIHQQLGGKQDEEVLNLEDARKRLELKRDELNVDLGRIDTKIEAVKEEVVRLQTLIRQIEDQEDAAARAQRRVNAVDDCVRLLEQILEAETLDLRPLLNDEIDKHFRAIMTKDYWAELTESYTLRIRKNVVGSESGSGAIDVALSTGERTVTSLVFIASLVALAERRSEIPTILKDVSGSAYPVAIDSPFGSLSIFREGVARHVPALAPQVMLLVSPEQYNGQVENALNESGRIGKRYYLRYHGPAMPERAAPELVVNGQRYKQYVADPTDEFTEVCEI